jgi:hypothetical protein
MAKPIVPSAALQTALTKAANTVNATSSHLEYLQHLAASCPEMQASVDELGVMHSHLDKLCRAGLSYGSGSDETGNRG